MNYTPTVRIVTSIIFVASLYPLNSCRQSETATGCTHYYAAEHGVLLLQGKQGTLYNYGPKITYWLFGPSNRRLTSTNTYYRTDSNTKFIDTSTYEVVQFDDEKLTLVSTNENFSMHMLDTISFVRVPYSSNISIDSVLIFRDGNSSDANVKILHRTALEAKDSCALSLLQQLYVIRQMSNFAPNIIHGSNSFHAIAYGRGTKHEFNFSLPLYTPSPFDDLGGALYELRR